VKGSNFDLISYEITSGPGESFEGNCVIEITEKRQYKNLYKLSTADNNLIDMNIFIEILKEGEVWKINRYQNIDLSGNYNDFSGWNDPTKNYLDY